MSLFYEKIQTFGLDKNSPKIVLYIDSQNVLEK